MTRSRLLLGVAAVLAGSAAMLAILGALYNPLIALAAVPFAIATALLWADATGRLHESMRARVRETTHGREADGADGRSGRRRAWGMDGRRGATVGDDRRAAAPRSASDPSRRAAAETLGVAPDADDATLRRAFRDRASDLHPDAPEGDVDEFRRVREAYERLDSER